MKDKVIAERINEIIQIYQKLNSLGINEDVCPDIKKFKNITNEFVKNGTSTSGKIKLYEINKKITYILSNKSHIISSVLLQQMPSYLTENIVNFNNVP